MRFKGHGPMPLSIKCDSLALRTESYEHCYKNLNQLCSSLWTSRSWLNFSRRKFRLGNVLDSQNKIFATRSPSFLFYKLVSSTLWPFCRSLLMYVRSVTPKKRQNTNPHLDGKFFVDLIGLGILRDDTATEMLLLLMFFVRTWKELLNSRTHTYMVHFQMVLQKFNLFHWSCLCKDFGCLFSLLNYMGSPQSKTKLLCVE